MLQKLLCCLLLLGSVALWGQDYKTLVRDAERHYAQKEFAQAYSLYQQAFLLKAESSEDLYNAACVAALASERKQAFKWLYAAIDKGWVNTSHLQKDTDLATLRDGKDWAKLTKAMQRKADKIEAKYDKPLRAELLAIFDSDQTIRHEYIAAIQQHGNKSPQADSLLRIMAQRDSLNQQKVIAILDKHGWVGSDKVGGQATHTLFIVIQHADITLQQKYIPLLREAVRKKQASGNALAFLEDRIASNTGKLQRYGTQIAYAPTTEEPYVYPIDDPDNVDARRAELDMSPMEEYVKRWKINWDVATYKQQLPTYKAWNKIE